MAPKRKSKSKSTKSANKKIKIESKTNSSPSSSSLRQLIEPSSSKSSSSSSSSSQKTFDGKTEIENEVIDLRLKTNRMEKVIDYLIKTMCFDTPPNEGYEEEDIHKSIRDKLDICISCFEEPFICKIKKEHQFYDPCQDGDEEDDSIEDS